MALFRNLGVNLRDRLYDVPRHASAQSLDFLELAKNCSFLDWKLTPKPTSLQGLRKGIDLEWIANTETDDFNREAFKKTLTLARSTGSFLAY